METGIKRAKKSERIRKKKKLYATEVEQKQKEHRPCEKNGCGEMEPRCCLQASDNCCRDGYTSRWYHMSLGEHFCNECFDYFYRPHKGGFQQYDSWYHKWYIASKVRPSIKRFVADEIMPYWLQCTASKCGKWREVRDLTVLTSEYIKKFKCSMLYENSQKNPCAVEEEACVSDLSKPEWLEQLSDLPLLKQSPAAHYLKQFCEEGIGLCPINTSSLPEMPKWIEPFSDALNGESSIWPRPDIVEREEQALIPLLPHWSPTFLGLRNLIVSVWNMAPHEWLTAEKLSTYIICRGLVRICLLLLTDIIIKFLSQNGTINYGFVMSPVENFLSHPKETVIVIGSGMAGLSAAKHLHNLGIKTVVLEASDKIGGRVQDEKTCGGTMINGLINNPLTILCHQANLDLYEVPSNPTFIKEDDGVIVSPEVTERMLHQFSGMMHGALEWSEQENVDANWFDTITKHQKDFHQLADFSEVEDLIFDFILKVTDVESRTNTKELTLKKFEFPKKLGNDGLVIKGFSSLVKKLAEGLDIHLQTVVQAVRFDDSKVEVITNNDCFQASRVIVAVPLPVLCNKHIKFYPPLSDQKTEAFQLLGNVMLEKVTLQFPKKFWNSVLKDKHLKFGIITPNNLAFQYFIDVSNTVENNKPTLITFINNFNISLIEDKSDKAIIDMCFSTLKNVFKKLRITVPKPTFCAVSHWYQNSLCGTSGSFVKVNSTYDLYDKIAEPVAERIFFAGEAAFRKLPNSVTGAFLSGLREAANIANLIHPVSPFNFLEMVSNHLKN